MKKHNRLITTALLLTCFVIILAPINTKAQALYYITSYPDQSETTKDTEISIRINPYNGESKATSFSFNYDPNQLEIISYETSYEWDTVNVSDLTASPINVTMNELGEFGNQSFIIFKAKFKDSAISPVNVSVTGGVIDNVNQQEVENINIYFYENSNLTDIDSKALLKKLLLSSGYIDFKMEQFEYSLTVPYTVQSILVTPTPQNNQDKVELAGDGELVVGSNKIQVKVASSNGNTNTYTIDVIREENTEINLDNNTNIDTIIVNDKEYNVSSDVIEIPYKDGTNINIEAKPESSTTNINIQGDTDLKNGSEISVIATAEDGSNKEYIIKLKKSYQTQIIIGIVVFVVGLLAIILNIVRIKKLKPKKYKHKNKI